MSHVNLANKEIQFKIVYYGPGLGGKTTNLQYLHRALSPQIRSDLISLSTSGDRTLFFDFLGLDLGEISGFKMRFALYTVPGQVTYNHSRREILRGVDGIIFVADSCSDRWAANIDSLENLEENLDLQGNELPEMPFVIQFNKRDLADIMPVHAMQNDLNKLQVPTAESSAIDGRGVMTTLKTLTQILITNAAREQPRR